MSPLRAVPSGILCTHRLTSSNTEEKTCLPQVSNRLDNPDGVQVTTQAVLSRVVCVTSLVFHTAELRWSDDPCL